MVFVGIGYKVWVLGANQKNFKSFSGPKFFDRISALEEGGVNFVGLFSEYFFPITSVGIIRK